MKKMSKGKKIAFWAVGIFLIFGLIGSLIDDETTETQPTTEVLTEQETETQETTEDTLPDLDTCCKAIAETLNVTYKENGFELHGQAYQGKEALYAIYMPYTTEEVKTLYAHDKQALRDLWGNIARTTWNYLSEQGYEVPADTEVILQVYAADNKKCIVNITKHDTKLNV